MRKALCVLVMVIMAILLSSTRTHATDKGNDPHGSHGHTTTVCSVDMMYVSGMCVPMPATAHDTAIRVGDGLPTPLDEEWAWLGMWAEEMGLPMPNGLYYLHEGMYVAFDGAGVGHDGAGFLSATASIYIGIEVLASYDASSPSLQPYLIAHEYGHFLQLYYGADYSSETAHEFELQADTTAGSFIKWLVENNLFDDMEAIDVQLAWEVGGVHGSPEQRHIAFYQGFRGGIRAVNGYFPLIP